MHGDKVSEMKKRLAACLSNINPDLDIDAKNAADWQQTFTIFEKELLGGRGRAKKPLFPILVSALFKLKTVYLHACKHAYNNVTITLHCISSL